MHRFHQSFSSFKLDGEVHICIFSRTQSTQTSVGGSQVPVVFQLLSIGHGGVNFNGHKYYDKAEERLWGPDFLHLPECGKTKAKWNIMLLTEPSSWLSSINEIFISKHWILNNQNIAKKIGLELSETNHNTQ